MTAAPARIQRLDGYGLTTAQIVYRVPDHLELLQEFIWQKIDLYPQFPELKKFLRFWEREIEGPLHSVTVAHKRLVHPAELQIQGGDYRLH